MATAAAGPIVAAEAAGAGVVAALASSRVGQKQFMPTALLAQHMPAGLGAMCSVPRLGDMQAETEAARLEEYIMTIRRTARVFEVCDCKQATFVEHDKYMTWVDGWAYLSGFGKYVVVDHEVSCPRPCGCSQRARRDRMRGVRCRAYAVWPHGRARCRCACSAHGWPTSDRSLCDRRRTQKAPGIEGFITPVMVAGKPKVMVPEMIVGVLLEMVTGSPLTPKGGLTKLIRAHEEGTEAPERKGAFGNGCYNEEGWSVTAVRKRVTAVRKFYETHLDGDKKEVNPGWQPIVIGTMVSITLTLGEEAQHVRSRARTQVLLCARDRGRE